MRPGTAVTTIPPELDLTARICIGDKGSLLGCLSTVEVGIGRIFDRRNVVDLADNGRGRGCIGHVAYVNFAIDGDFRDVSVGMNEVRIVEDDEGKEEDRENIMHADVSGGCHSASGLLGLDGRKGYRLGKRTKEGMAEGI